MLITNARVVTWDRPNEIIENASLIIADGRIAEVGPARELADRHAQEQRLDARGQFVLPGNINTHSHYYSSFVKGMAVPGEQPWNLPTILERLWFPFDKALREEDVRYSVFAALVDAIKHGTTTLFDHHSSPDFIEGSLDVIAEVVAEAGVRSVLCFEVTDRGGAERAGRSIGENVRFINRCEGERIADGRIAANFGIHACMTATEETLAQCRDAAPEQAAFHVHVGEHEYDQYRSLAMAGTRSVDRLHSHGLLTDRSIAAHAIHLDAREVRILAEAGTWVSHQPRNNMNVADGIAEVESYLRAGVPVSVGNDGMSQTMWKEWEFASIAQKIKHRDARRLPPDRLIEMTIYNSAELAGRYFTEAPIGKIAPGAVADLIFVDYHPVTPLTAETLPAHILFGFNESMVTTTIVAGQVLMLDRTLLTLDEERIAARCRELVPDLWGRYEESVPLEPILG